MVQESHPRIQVGFVTGFISMPSGYFISYFVSLDVLLVAVLCAQSVLHFAGLPHWLFLEILVSFALFRPEVCSCGSGCTKWFYLHVKFRRKLGVP